MAKTDKKSKHVRQELAEKEFPAKWVKRFRFAEYVWEWWPDRTKLAEFVELMKLVVGDA